MVSETSDVIVREPICSQTHRLTDRQTEKTDYWVYPMRWIDNKSSAVAEMGGRLATIDMGRKVGRGCCGGGLVPSGSPSNTMCLGPTPTSLPSDILIHPAVDHNCHNCRNATLLRVGIPLQTIFIPSLVVTRQNIYSTRLQVH